ncbi:hypothetical protein EVAR_48955_1 [Eumeta japonica]|uniref:Uncharacterized protein n=1 Tax=Eumeta variegata TaxID=151549 RepID=A0A4C1Y8W0_EUMVA|nr:hypothetical protein EVAR_48955_1 [Eumeta japonica]
MQAARHRGHYGRAERVGTAASGAYRTLKGPTRRAPTTLRTTTQTGAGARGRGHRLADVCVAEPCPPPTSTTTRNPVPHHPPLSACAMTRAPEWPATKRRRWEARPADTYCPGCCRPTRGQPDQRSAGALASDHRRSAACAACSAPPSRPRQLPPHNPVPLPPAIERMRDDARARGWSGVGTGSTPRQGKERKEEVEGRGSLTRTALAAAVRRVDSLISGRQARLVRSTPTRVTDACRLDPVGVHQRPTTGGRLRVQLELCLPRRAPTYAGAPPPPGCACAMTARARVWVGDWAPARCQSMDPPATDHCHLSRRGRVPDEKTPGHEATISPPSRTCTLKIEGVEDPRARASQCICLKKCMATPPQLKCMQLTCATDAPPIKCSWSGASGTVASQPSYCEARLNKEDKSERKRCPSFNRRHTARNPLNQKRALVKRTT